MKRPGDFWYWTRGSEHCTHSGLRDYDWRAAPLVQCDLLFIEMMSCPPMAIVQMTDPYETNQ